jgi:hypothetical protein
MLMNSLSKTNRGNRYAIQVQGPYIGSPSTTSEELEENILDLAFATTDSTL